MQSVGVPFLSLCVNGPVLSAAPAFDHLDFHLHGDPVVVIGVWSGVQDLVHPGHHDLLDEPRHLLGLRLRALDDQLVVHGEDQTGL